MRRNRRRRPTASQFDRLVAEGERWTRYQDGDEPDPISLPDQEADDEPTQPPLNGPPPDKRKRTRAARLAGAVVIGTPIEPVRPDLRAGGPPRERISRNRKVSAEETLLCTVCMQDKPVEEFKPKGTFYEHWCGECRRRWYRDRYASLPPEDRELARRRIYDTVARGLYGAGVELRDELLARQDGRCGICRRKLTRGRNRTSAMHLDHDHYTRVIRGLLCSRCNQGLGVFDDSPELLMRALAWVRLEHFDGERLAHYSA